jgi:rhamnose transport system ATP-binding protein
VSIAKALAGEANILILDELSAILTDAEIEVRSASFGGSPNQGSR